MSKKQETMMKNSSINVNGIVTFFTIFTFSSALLFTNLGVNVLANWDEAWYADASRFMFRNDHFLTPVWNNQYFFDKPPLQYWLTQPFLWIFGEKEIAYRLPSAIAGIVLTLLVYQWGESRNGISGGLVAALALLSFPHFLDRSRSGNFDALFTMWTTLSLWVFMRSIDRRRGHTQRLAPRSLGEGGAAGSAIAGVFLGLAWLTKGVFSGFFPIVVIALFLIYDVFRLRSFRLFLPTIYYLLSTILIYAPWHILELTRFGGLINNSYFATFDQGAFGSWNWMEIADRFNLRYLVFLWTFLRWWFPVALVAIGWSIARLIRSSKSLLSFLPLFSFLTIFLTLSAAREENDWYLMPTYPLIALLISDFAHYLFLIVIPRATRNLFQYRFPIRSGMTAMMFITLTIALSNLYLYRSQAFPPNNHLVEKDVAEFVKDHTSPNDLIVTAEYEFPTLRYYSEREVRTAARQPDFQGAYWWIWDNVDIETALQEGRTIVTITRPGAEWPVDVWGYHRERIEEINGRMVSRFVAN